MSDMTQMPASPPRRRTAVIVGSLVIAVALIGAAGAFALRSERPSGLDAEAAATSQAATIGEGAALTVNLVHPVPILWPDAISASGPIAAWQEAAVSAEIGGARIAEVLVDVGDQVRRGQLLVRFDEASLRAAVAQQKAALAEARARLADTSASAHRAVRLRESYSISEQDLIRAVTAAQAAQAQVDLAQARLEAQQLGLDDTRVVAPDDGVISMRSAMLGAVAAPGMELFRLVRQNRLEWRAELTAVQLPRVAPGARAELRLPDGTTMTGAVRQVSPLLDEKTRIGMAYVELGAAAAVRAGMYASGSIVLGERAGLALPASAVVLRDGHEFVFIVDAEGRVVQSKVTVGRRRGGEIEIVEGLAADEAVVGSGAAFLNDGDRVRVVETSVAAAAGASA